MTRKIYDSAEAALDGLLFDGMFIAADGFGLGGTCLNVDSLNAKFDPIGLEPSRHEIQSSNP